MTVEQRFLGGGHSNDGANRWWIRDRFLKGNRRDKRVSIGHFLSTGGGAVGHNHGTRIIIGSDKLQGLSGHLAGAEN